MEVFRVRIRAAVVSPNPRLNSGINYFPIPNNVLDSWILTAHQGIHQRLGVAAIGDVVGDVHRGDNTDAAVFHPGIVIGVSRGMSRVADRAVAGLTSVRRQFVYLLSQVK